MFFKQLNPIVLATLFISSLVYKVFHGKKMVARDRKNSLLIWLLCCIYSSTLSVCLFCQSTIVVAYRIYINYFAAW